jgi:hypothetical protein
MSFIKAGDPISTSTTITTHAPAPEKPNLKRTLQQREQSIKDEDEDDEDEDDVKKHHLGSIEL